MGTIGVTPRHPDMDGARHVVGGTPTFPRLDPAAVPLGTSRTAVTEPPAKTRNTFDQGADR